MYVPFLTPHYGTFPVRFGDDREFKRTRAQVSFQTTLSVVHSPLVDETLSNTNGIINRGLSAGAGKSRRSQGLLWSARLDQHAAVVRQTNKEQIRQEPVWGVDGECGEKTTRAPRTRRVSRSLSLSSSASLSTSIQKSAFAPHTLARARSRGGARARPATLRLPRSRARRRPRRRRAPAARAARLVAVARRTPSAAPSSR